MRAALFSMLGWKESDTAPLGTEVILAVTDGGGEPYLLHSPCKRAAGGWIQLQKRNPTARHAREMETLCQAPRPCERSFRREGVHR
jgi:hypothetical protein